jgi:hypothetical protein
MKTAKILVISNRVCNSECTSDDLFGQDFNQSGPSELRVAEAKFDQQTSRWCLNLLPEDRSQPDNVCQESNKIFQDIVDGISKKNEEIEKWVIFVPGYCSPCLEGLNKSLQLQEYHGVNVILFSWPSDPREPVLNPIESYRRTQEAARISAVALDRVLSSLNRVFVQPARLASRPGHFKFSLLAHSLGNYLIQNLVQLIPIHEANKIQFDNIILHQPDVDLEGSQFWIKSINAEGHKYVTTNEYDETLRYVSNFVNPERLGQVTHHVGLAGEIVHVDFTKARHINNEHWFFGNKIDNTIINSFCTKVLRGEPGENSLFIDENEEGRYQAFPFEHFPTTQRN